MLAVARTLALMIPPQDHVETEALTAVLVRYYDVYPLNSIQRFEATYRHAN
jgi:hypothetical protein